MTEKAVSTTAEAPKPAATASSDVHPTWEESQAAIATAAKEYRDAKEKAAEEAKGAQPKGKG